MTPLVLCTLTLIVTLAVSGFAKAKEPTSTVTALVNLKLDHLVPVKPVARILPWAELALAVALAFLPGVFQVLAAVLALLLFAVYWGVIARAIIQGNTASCNCFGSASQAPISMFTLIRNTALLAAAFATLFAALETKKSALGMLLATDAQGWLWMISAGFALLALWAIYRSELVAVEEAPEPAAAGSSAVVAAPVAAPLAESADAGQELEEEEYYRHPIPFAALYYPTAPGQDKGVATSLRELARDKARVLVWVSAGCGHCHGVIAKISSWQEQLPMLGVHPVVATESEIKTFDVAENIQFLIDPGYETEQLFGSGTPGALALGMDGLLAGGPVFGSTDVIDFVEDIVAQLSEGVEEEVIEEETEPQG